MKITQDLYEKIVFLTRCVYFDLPYPVALFGYQQAVVLLSGLRMNLFIGKDFDLIVICGTNSLRDWVANFKVGLGITPRQYQQALNRILQHYSTMNKDKKLIISGHSLGSGIAEYCTSFMASDVYCIGFNGCGTRHLCQNKDNSNITHIVTDRDILNGITEKLPSKNYMKHMGKVNIIKDRTTINPIKSHCNFDLFMKFKIENENRG